ncbi:MAG: HdeD family acid-resistance protein [Ktedonobacteraceae bacterium]|nr:HdeD family acid-resistance protein [Ktedonobacteraceae bacterium]
MNTGLAGLQVQTPVHPWWLVLLQGIAAAVVGILLLISPALTLLLLVQILGIYWLISGLFALVSLFMDRSMWGWKLFIGILGVLAGIAVIRHPLWSTVLIPLYLIVFLGITGVITGIVQIVEAFKGAGWGVGILGILSVIVGVFLLIKPFAAALALPVVLGVFGIIGGLAAIWGAFRMRADSRSRQAGPAPI